MQYIKQFRLAIHVFFSQNKRPSTTQTKKARATFQYVKVTGSILLNKFGDQK